MTQGKGTYTGMLWGAFALGALGMVASFRFNAERFWANWVLWFLFFFTVALGALFIVALEHLVNARWSVPLRRIPERLATLLLPAAAMGILALAAVPILYPGAKPEAIQNKILAGKVLWLGLPFFSIRVVLCLGLCLLSLFVLVRGSWKQDTSRDPQFNVRARRFALLFMALFALAITQAAFDWISALTPEWYSDILGVYLFAGAFLGGLAATTFAVLRLQASDRLPGIRQDHLYNLGGFTFAFTVFWSYIGFAQYMLMWYGDMPDEVVWYKLRIDGPWFPVTMLLVILHGLIPFLALLTRDAKQDRRVLGAIALAMLVAHLVDLYWLIFPALGKGVLLSWPELSFALCFLSLGLLWIGKATELGADMPLGDPFLQEGLEFRL